MPLSKERGLYSKHRIDARAREIETTLTFSDFLLIIKRPCYLCGIPPSNDTSRIWAHNGSINHIKYSGIDRLDNSLGYHLGNVEPCCKNCNFIKHKFDSKELLCHLKKMLPGLQKFLSEKHLKLGHDG